MNQYVAIAVFAFVVLRGVNAPPPLRVTIDCGRNEVPIKPGGLTAFRKPPSISADNFNVDTFCQLIHNAIPKAVKDGKFVLVEPEDQATYADTAYPVAMAPPKGFAVPKVGTHKLRLPKLKVPKINVPTLRSAAPGLQAPGLHAPGLQLPRAGSPVLLPLPALDETEEEETSSERMERFKKGVQKLFHVVKVLGQVDQYLSERTRIVVEKLSKTFAE